MSFYTCFDGFKKLRFFSYVLNLKIDIIPKASRAVVIRWISLNGAPLWLFKFISDYFPYFEKLNIFFNIITKKFELIYKDWSKLFVRFIRNNLNQVVHILALHGLHGVYNLLEVISSWTEQKLRSILKCVVVCYYNIELYVSCLNWRKKWCSFCHGNFVLSWCIIWLSKFCN